MIKNTLKNTKEFLLNNHKFIRLVFFASFGKLLYTVILVAYNINNLLIYRFDKGFPLQTTLQYFIENIISSNLLWLAIIILVFVLIGYVFLFPTGISASIHFLKDKKSQIGKAMGKGISDFFIMFELVALSFSFGIYTYAITVLRLFTLGILNSNIAIILVVVRGIVVLFAGIFWQYAKFILVVEKKHEKDKEDEKIGIFGAIKKSITLSINNIGITFKGWIMQIIFFLVFYFKGFIIISIPLLLIYFLISSGFSTPSRIISLLGTISIILTIYIISIIQSFFRKFWFDIYQRIKILEKEDN